MINPKPILSPNSKKYLKGKVAVLVFASLTAKASGSQHDLKLIQHLKADIRSQMKETSSFEKLTKTWETTYGVRALQPLIQIASDKKNKDSDRYIALMSAAKLGGTGTTPQLIPFLHDPSWMLREGALRALCAVGNSQTGEATLLLLHDPALVVRVEAIETVKTLKPKGAVKALFATLKDEHNYHAGKAQWVPQKALLALAEIHATEIISDLKPLLKSPRHRNDPEFRTKIQDTLKSLGREIRAP